MQAPMSSESANHVKFFCAQTACLVISHLQSLLTIKSDTGDTLQRVLYGGGQFYTAYGKPVPQNPGDSFFIPKGKPHAFDGQLHGPSVVIVQWSPPYHEGYIIPTTGCKDMPNMASFNNSDFGC